MANPLYGSNKFDNQVDKSVGAVVDKSASYSVTAAMSGEIHILKGAAITVTLPAVAVGLEYKFISSDASEHVLSGGASVIQGSGIMTGDKTQFYSDTTSLTLIDGVSGDSFSVVSDGTNWYCFNSAKNGITAA